ncbi:MAG: aminoglycoside 6-adenylyltransferase [Anaerolineales bacterium]|nr:aminoglycoside 6-adenylyltransferase [Anaerolineales bacterium]
MNAFLQRIVHWAQTQPDLLAVALVGSHARGDARPDSDVDLVLISSESESRIAHNEWIGVFGEPAQIQREIWEKVTSLRVNYKDRLEVEFGVAAPSWGSDPNDKGDARVIQDGIIVLYEQGRLLSERIKQMSYPPSPSTEQGKPTTNSLG